MCNVKSVMCNGKEDQILKQVQDDSGKGAQAGCLWHRMIPIGMIRRIGRIGVMLLGLIPVVGVAETASIVPRVAHEGKVGTASKPHSEHHADSIWAEKAYLDNITGTIDSATHSVNADSATYSDTTDVVKGKAGYPGNCIPAWLDSIHGCSQIVIDPDSIKFLTDSLFRVVTEHNAIGMDCYAPGQYSTVGGGRYDTASGEYYSTVGGGYLCRATAIATTVGGGDDNIASGHSSTVAGGVYGRASGNGSFIGGGESNATSGNTATVSGGYADTASGDYSTIPGGYQNLVEVLFGFAAGYQARVTGDESDSASMVLGTGVVDSVPYACIINGDGDDTLSTAHHTLIGTDLTVDGSVTATSYSGTSDMYNDSSGLFLRRNGIASLTGDLTVDDVDIRGIETVETDTGIFNDCVGIGTTPTYKLDIAGPTGSAAVRVDGGCKLDADHRSGGLILGDNSTVQLEFSANWSDGCGYVDQSYDHVSGDIIFRTRTAGTPVEVMRLTGDNYCGINTTGPDRKLDVFDASGPQIRATHTDDSVYTDLQTTSTGKFIIDASGDSVELNCLLSVDSMDIVRAGARTWNFRYTAHDSLGAIPTLHIDTDKDPGLGFYINEDCKLAIWDVTHPLPDNPAGSGKFALSTWGDICVGDIYSIEVNPIAIGKRITPLDTCITTSYYSNRNINSDTNGGAGITLAADQTGAVASGYVNIVAWGQGTDSLANSIMFSNRNAGTLQRRMMLDKDGNLALGIHDPESAIDVYKNTNPAIALRRTATTGWAHIKFLDAKDAATRWEMGKAASDDTEGNAFYLYWGGTAGRVMTIDTSGIIKAEHEFEGVGAERYVDRGDPAAWDFTLVDSTADAGWHDLDLSSILPAAAANKRVKLKMQLTDDAAGTWLQFRQNGESNNYDAWGIQSQVANVSQWAGGEVEVDGDRKIEYRITNGATLTNADLLVRGWYQDE